MAVRADVGSGGDATSRGGRWWSTWMACGRRRRLLDPITHAPSGDPRNLWADVDRQSPVDRRGSIHDGGIIPGWDGR